jgi:8-oxo-dGTP pyrophosphatase MutT (NUDIX family)
MTRADLTEPGEVLVKGQTLLRPRDAATLVILDRSDGEVKVLMGRRRDDLAFMAGKFVFPGGRVDPTDRGVALAGDLRPHESAKLLTKMRGRPSRQRARAIALAAVREAFEEAGLLIGRKGQDKGTGTQPDTWRGFAERDVLPALDRLTFFARAITPPGRPRRFDTRFFCVDAAAIAERAGHNDGELSALDWLTLEEARGLDIPRITRLVLEDLTEQLADGSLDAGTNPVPFYYQRGGSFKRDLIRA